MNEHVQRGFLKEAGLMDFARSAVSKVKSFFSGGGGGSVGAQVVKLGPRPAAAARPAVPKMQRLSGTSSISTPMRAPTPQQQMNSRIRSEMKRNDFAP